MKSKTLLSFFARLFKTFNIIGQICLSCIIYVTLFKIEAPLTSQLVFVKYQMVGKSMYLADVSLAHYSDCPIGTTPLVMFTRAPFIA